MTKAMQKKSIKWWVSTGLFLFLFICVGVYSYAKMRVVINGVKVTAAIEKSESSMTYIKGNARNATYVSLNGREIFIDKTGEFREPISLLSGLGVVTIQAQDKFGNVSQKEFEVVYKDTDHVALLISD